ncbi:hypothetical protein EDC96DRAFT_252398 [Choanephora cucurbitarum]|nr:hypothetical protein EDC96DRAFT_252398 [Choanephora cucurbitarum]
MFPLLWFTCNFILIGKKSVQATALFFMVIVVQSLSIFILLRKPFPFYAGSYCFLPPYLIYTFFSSYLNLCPSQIKQSEKRYGLVVSSPCEGYTWFQAALFFCCFASS